MGSYTDLSVAGYPILETKSYVVAEAMTIFREMDRRAVTRKLSERNALVWGKVDADRDDEEETAILYTCETAKITDRLDVMGFTLTRARADFESTRTSELESLSSDTDDVELRALLEKLTWEHYGDALRIVMKSGLTTWNCESSTMEKLGPIVRYILDSNNDAPLGFFCSDIRSLVRLACELVEPTSRVIQDITEVVSGRLLRGG